MGVVGGGRQPGDPVCITQGASIPMVLGRCDVFHGEAGEKGIQLEGELTEAKFFTQVRVGYIHGIMDGEAMIAAERQKIGIERIILV